MLFLGLMTRKHPRTSRGHAAGRLLIAGTLVTLVSSGGLLFARDIPDARVGPVRPDTPTIAVTAPPPAVEAAALTARPPAVEAIALPAAPHVVEAAASPALLQQRARRSRPTRRRPARAAPAPRYTMPATADALNEDIGSMLAGRTRSGHWGVMIVSLTRGDTLYARNAGEMLHPASTMKLFTAALALDRLGPDHHFSTDVLRHGSISPDGTLSGDLILRGGGDPAFSNRFLRGDPDIPLELLARFVAESGVRRVRGDLVADESAFDSRRIPEGWQLRNLGFGYAAPVSALSVNENVVWVVVRPASGRTRPQVTLEPSSSTMSIRNAVTSRAGRGGNIIVRRTGDTELEVRGWIGVRSIPRRYLVVVQEPALFTAGAFRDALAKQGVVVEGTIRIGQAPSSAVRVASLPSPPLSRLLSVMNRESVNHYAELIYRNAVRGPDPDGVGSAERALAELQRFMTSRTGAVPGTVYATDGSGLSLLDRVTPRSLVQLLDYAHRAPWSSAFHASLPVAGESELLRHRMRYTPAQGNLHAKTGTTNQVISLAGYATARNGEVIAFAFLYNGNDRSNARETIDQMGATLASFIRE